MKDYIRAEHILQSISKLFISQVIYIRAEGDFHIDILHRHRQYIHNFVVLNGLNQAKQLTLNYFFLNLKSFYTEVTFELWCVFWLVETSAGTPIPLPASLVFAESQWMNTRSVDMIGWNSRLRFDWLVFHFFSLRLHIVCLCVGRMEYLWNFSPGTKGLA